MVLAVIALTSLAALWLGARRGGLDVWRLRTAALESLDCVWTVLAFLAANIGGTIAMVSIGRMVVPEYLSIYVAGDLTLVVVSAVQGVLFHLWRRGRAHP